MAAASNEDWRRLWLSMVASLQSERLGRAQQLLADADSQRARVRYELNTSEIGRLSESFAAEFQNTRSNPDAQRYQAPIQLESQTHGNRVPHRATLAPFDAMAFENLSGDDKKWWDEQQARFASDSLLLPTKPNFDLLVFETVNFMDGRRTTAQIADLLSAEFPLPLDEAWVNRLVAVLEKQGLVAER
jgi:hypothetical protein